MSINSSPMHFAGQVYSTHKKKHRAKQAQYDAQTQQAILARIEALEKIDLFQRTKEQRQKIEQLELAAKEASLQFSKLADEINVSVQPNGSAIERIKETKDLEQRADNTEAKARFIKAAYDKQTMVNMFGENASKVLLKKGDEQEKGDDDDGRGQYDFYS